MARTFDNGTWTSEFAAKEAQSFRPIIEARIRAELEARKELGATDQELQMCLSIPGNSERPARVDLVKEGWVVDSGKWRMTIAKRPAIVWVLRQYEIKEDE